MSIYTFLFLLLVLAGIVGLVKVAGMKTLGYALLGMNIAAWSLVAAYLAFMVPWFIPVSFALCIVGAFVTRAGIVGLVRWWPI